jgi:hypothetical protein
LAIYLSHKRFSKYFLGLKLVEILSNKFLNQVAPQPETKTPVKKTPVKKKVIKKKVI